MKTFTNAWMKLACSEAIRRSQASTMPMAPPATVPLSAAMKRLFEFAEASSMPSRVSLVNLQKLILKPWLEMPSMWMLAPAEKMRSLPLSTTTTRTAGCSKRSRWIASCSSMSTPRS